MVDGLIINDIEGKMLQWDHILWKECKKMADKYHQVTSFGPVSRPPSLEKMDDK